MRRRGRLLLKLAAALLVVLLAGAFIVRALLEPERLSAFLLERAGELSGLDLQLESPAKVGFWPDLHLELQGLSASQPGAPTPMLRVKRAVLSLPWSSVTGDDVKLTSLRLIEPDLDWAALEAWLARDESQSGPPAPPRLPTFDAAIQIIEARIRAPGWRIERLGLSLPLLIENTATRLDAKGMFTRNDIPQRFALALDTTPAWSRGELRLDPLDLSLRLDDAGIAPLAIAGDIRFDGLRLALVAQTRFARWPERFPALPLPESHEDPVTLSLGYAGDASFHGDAVLNLQRGDETLAAALRLGDALGWLSGSDANLLPPLTGSVDAERLHISGIDIDGFKLRLDAGDEADAADGKTPPSGKTE